MQMSFLHVITVVVILQMKTLEAAEFKEVKLGDMAVLTCNISLHHEIMWLRVSMKEKPRILMVAILKNDGELSVIWNYNSTHYEGQIVDKYFGLRISRVLGSDLASYYCATVYGRRMEFEEGVHVYAKPTEPWKEIRAGNISKTKKVMPTEPRTEIRAGNISKIEKVADVRLNPYPIFAAVLGVGQLGMLLAVLVVHIMACKKNA